MIFSDSIQKKIKKNSIKIEPTWIKNISTWLFSTLFSITTKELYSWRCQWPTIFTSFSYQDKRLAKSWWHLQSRIFYVRPLENAHFRAKNAKCVCDSVRLHLYAHMLMKIGSTHVFKVALSALCAYVRELMSCQASRHNSLKMLLLTSAELLEKFYRNIHLKLLCCLRLNLK